MTPSALHLMLIGGVIIVLALAWLIVRSVLRRDECCERDGMPFSEDDMPDPAPTVSAPVRPAAPITPPVPTRPVVPPEPSIYTYPGLRGGWWVCPNCACENEPEQTHCGVCLWDRSVGVG